MQTTLINDILKRGGARCRLEVKLFGGASLMGASAIGTANGEFVLRYLKDEGLTVAARDLYGVYPRRVHYFPSSGQAHVLALRRRGDLAMIADEVHYQEQLDQNPIAGSVELFGEGGQP
jgi:chemotaxis protein CheD